MGQFAEEAGTRGYSNLIGAYPMMTVRHDEQSVSTYGYTGNQWWSFDDTWSIGKKAAYVKNKGLLGVMVWEMSGGHPAGDPPQRARHRAEVAVPPVTGSPLPVTGSPWPGR
ncbi:glycosyl hydrolase family 18 (putative chitinase) [Streptomyces brevispora]|uniref:chitinase n=1 Tax=Streptomyces brevispora TaxID=887462 RepID=A0A561V4W3_9ACTN|nr:glycosyl hydrolase family 18 (putative chitinase) [Streptomyces brevispora]